jgi:hypothetical protein
VAGAESTSLQKSLLAIALPTTPGGDPEIYDAAVKAALDASRTQLLSGVQQIFAGKLPVVPINASTTSSSTSTAGTSSSSASGGTSTTTA